MPKPSKHPRPGIAYTVSPKKAASSSHRSGKDPCDVQASQRPSTGLHSKDDVLLIGEGDFSFAYCLLQHHAGRYSSMTATSLDFRSETLSKYPQAGLFIRALSCTEYDEQERRTVPDQTVCESKTKSANEGQDDQEIGGTQSDPSFIGFSDSDDSDKATPIVAPSSSEHTATPSQDTAKVSRRVAAPDREARHMVYYSTDATKLAKHPQLKRRRFNKIFFNFPHVGGKSTDVNRQVRYNQEMLHAFLGQAKQMLEACQLGDRKERQARHERRQNSDRYDTDEEDEEDPEADSTAGVDSATTHSRHYGILVTLFEGEPYSLWNIKDLARSNGLECRTSWAFDWNLYPGYHHARTLGNLRNPGKTATAEEHIGHVEEDLIPRRNKSKGPGWRGEDRKARTFEFGLKEKQQRRHKHGKKRKRKSGQDSSSSESD